MNDRNPGKLNSVMEGGGCYNLNSNLQAAGGLLALPAFEQAAAEMSAADKGARPIVIADYGSSQGRNSLALVRRAIVTLRRRFGPERPICVVHTDLPSNDFSTLFTTVEEAADGYARGDPNVFPSAVGRSFYRPVLPNNSVDLGWSSFAALWLSKLPGSVPNHIIGARSTGALRHAFTEQAKIDWENFLSLRAAELRSGGYLVVCLPSLEDDGSHAFAPVFDIANDVIAEMVVEGEIDADERAGMCLGNYPRTPAELLEPFTNGGSRFPLHLITSSFSSEDSDWVVYQQDGDTGGFL